MQTIQQKIEEATQVVRAAWQAGDSAAEHKPTVIITTGSGLGAIAEGLTSVSFEMSYDAIPHLPASRVVGHAGRLVIGHYGDNTGNDGEKVILLDGRVHGYEGHDPLTQVLPLLIANKLCDGARLALFTNAAGAINETYHVGQIMLIKDHINFTGQTLVTLDEASLFGGDNLDMTFAYSPEYRAAFKELAYKKFELLEGIYIGVRGAMFETPAEIRAFRSWGADAVGMSTVHEVVAASHLNIDTVGLSVITNMAAGIEPKQLTHQEVLDNTAEASKDLMYLISGLLSKNNDR